MRQQDLVIFFRHRVTILLSEHIQVYDTKGPTGSEIVPYWITTIPPPQNVNRWDLYIHILHEKIFYSIKSTNKPYLSIWFRLRHISSLWNSRAHFFQFDFRAWKTKPIQLLECELKGQLRYIYLGQATFANLLWEIKWSVLRRFADITVGRWVT